MPLNTALVHCLCGHDPGGRAHRHPNPGIPVNTISVAETTSSAVISARRGVWPRHHRPAPTCWHTGRGSPSSRPLVFRRCSTEPCIAPGTGDIDCAVGRINIQGYETDSGTLFKLPPLPVLISLSVAVSMTAIQAFARYVLSIHALHYHKQTIAHQHSRRHFRFAIH